MTIISTNSDLYAAIRSAILADVVDFDALRASSLDMSFAAMLGYVAGRECCPGYKGRAMAWNLSTGYKFGTYASFGEAYDEAYMIGRDVRMASRAA